MKTFSIGDIRSWKPCYDPGRHLPEGWSGTALDILRMETIPPKDRLWVVCRDGLLSDKTLRLFAVWGARQVQHLMTDPRSLKALDVAEAFAHGKATQDQLKDSAAAAWAAAWAAARAAARATAAWADAAWADAAARAAAARATARAADAAAWAAADAADGADADTAAFAAYAATWAADAAAADDAARAAQVAQLIEMIEEEEK
jgi:hypothetical protein